MAAIRQEKVAELIRRDLSVLFQQNSSSWFAGMFISVTQVRMSPDLGLAKVYLSFMAVPDKKVALEKVELIAGTPPSEFEDAGGTPFKSNPDG